MKRITILFAVVILLAALVVPALAEGNPTIQSDKPDYAPGELVTLTGMNWLGDAQVQVVVNDDYGSSWSHTYFATVAADGTIKDSFNLPDWFVATYFVRATGWTGSLQLISSGLPAGPPAAWQP